MRGVFERPKGSGVWWINYYDSDDRRHREKIGRESVAEEAYLQRRTELREGKFIAPRSASQFTFRELAEERMTAKKPLLAKRSFRSDEVRLAPLIEILGATPARSISSQAVEQALAQIAARPGCGPSTVNRYRTLLSSVFSVGVRNGRVQVNPLKQVQRRREPPGRIRFLSGAEEKKLRRAIRRRGRHREAQFDLALHTGLRRDEQFRLRWEDVDLERNALTIIGKGSRRRTIELNEPARKALLCLHRISNGSSWVSPDHRDDSDYDWSTWFEESVAESGIPHFTRHDVRHTFASRLRMLGVDLGTIQEFLGHSSIVTTMRYAHLAQEHRHSAVAKLATWHQDGTTRRARRPKVVQMAMFQH